MPKFEVKFTIEGDDLTEEDLEDDIHNTIHSVSELEVGEVPESQTTIVVIIDSIEWVTPQLLDVPDEATKEEILEAASEELGLDPIDLEEAQVFELEPVIAERIKSIKWEETFCDGDMDSQNLHKALVYCAFAKGGPIELERIEVEEEK